MKFAAAASLLLASVAHCAQDSAYYPGFSNPNVDDEMYYREAINVVQDLETGEFDSLYIRYHSCVWSEYGSGENQEPNEASGCGGDGNDELWYSGRTQCFRANVAYSLYGVKAGKSSATPCGQAHYINSFFTTGGIESFGDYVGIDYGTYGVSTTCTATFVGYDGNNTQGENPAHGQMYHPDYTSSTLGCSAKGQFIDATFKGAHCDGNHFLESTGSIENLNDDLESLGCHKIYDASSNDNGDIDLSAAYLLSASAACSHTEYPNRCPDPHGLKRKRDQRLHNYAQAHYRSVPLIMPILSTLLLLGAITMYCLANGVRDATKRRAIESSTGECQSPSMYEQFSMSFARMTTDISTRTRTFTEKLAQYAEEEEEEDYVEQVNNYEAPIVAGESTSKDAPPAVSTVDSMVSAASAAIASVTSAMSRKVPSVAPSVHSEKASSVASVHSEKAPSVAPSVHSEKAPSVAPSVHSEKSSSVAPSVHSEQQAQVDVANAMLAEKGVVPSAAVSEPEKKKYKRPRMAKISRWIRGRFGRRKNVNNA